MSIEKYPISNEPLGSNPWLSGFIEADASFQVRTTLSGKYPKLECKLEISQRRVDHKGYDNLEFLNYIAEFLETEVKKISSSARISQNLSIELELLTLKVILMLKIIF